ncbi:MAG: MptD family putative ECF transporter S component [Clostridium sp.]|jgi:energy-coupling factor transport system substrate-specific component|uniref:MptD family putative ECF transporter S component n=1 Tax=Clostridium sp. TaxID=1506 RepID=UPI0025B9680E|nr:MptD family putative ECF transporter S component [Clostridium sp.]MCH3963499.1 MptD family putative ECF transporter S component [Clostridium sp.]MCI1714640.1 MptD family putative ECF transporter S component [Clostridium sp.]MCI1799171.1 MptD family putative ECF transporter S component [Clostridium sp.]MCI1812823.1 MptD family putative ECF transporter S component [Clostridium sp.]MCI1869713.1 MptD family putative ECF transporter S component [Clostridium sp.]
MKKKNYSKKSLSVKDLITTGIFSALLFIAIMIGGIPFATNPITTFYMPVGASLLGGPIFLLLVAKVQKPGSITIAGVLCGIIFFATGMHWGMDIGIAIGGFIGDIIASNKKYKNIKNNIIAYNFLCLGLTGTYISYFINPEKWSRYMLNGGTDINYINTMNSVAHNWMLIVIILGTIVIATISGLIGKKLLKKQFEKAGIIS